MNAGSCIFSQIMEFVPWRSLEKIVEQYHGDFRVTTLKTHQLFRVMAFAQLTGRRSLRATVTSLNAQQSKLYRMGIDGVSLNNLSNALMHRDWRIFAEFGQLLMAEAAELFIDTPSKLDLDAKVFALDSTTIDLCLSLFPWADFRSTKAAVKAHVLLDTDTAMPVFVRVLPGKTHDVNVLDDVPIFPGAFYVMDKAYNDFTRLYALHKAGGWFVVRAKSNTQLRRQYSRPIDKTTGVRCDQTVVFKVAASRKKYPDQLRRIHFYDEELRRRFVFLTNHFSLPAETIAALYKRRWQVELFFKWIKQNLRVKTFFGRSQNAVKSQLWIAISTYLLVAKVRHFLQLAASMSEILHILELFQFEKTPIFTLFTPDPTKTPPTDCSEQLFLPGF